jgi:hypothetical protein
MINQFYAPLVIRPLKSYEKIFPVILVLAVHQFEKILYLHYICSFTYKQGEDDKPLFSFLGNTGTLL